MRRTLNRFRAMDDERGMSVVEASIILMVLSLLTAVLSPSINDYVDDANQTKARADLGAAGAALSRLLKDTGETMALLSGTVVGGAGPSHASGNRVTMLVGDGKVPTAAVARGGLTNWDSSNGVPAPAVVMTIADQLALNTPNYRHLANMNQTSATGNFDPGSGGTFNSEYGWRGAYLSEPLGTDPWGYRYAINTEFLGRISGGAQVNFDNDVFVVSAGPNGVVDTAFATANATPASDDLLYLVSGGLQ